MADRSGLFVAPLPGATPQGTSPTDGRLVLGTLYGTSGGCLSGGTLTASATQMQVYVAAAVWRIPDPSNGGAVFLSPADGVNLTFSAGPASGSRIDIIWVRQNNFEAGDANSRVIYGIAAGTAASSPVAPALPAGAMEIGRLTVPTGASNAAACVLVPKFAGMSVLPPQIRLAYESQLPTGQPYGQMATVDQVNVAGVTIALVERWNATAWRRWESEWNYFTPTWTGLAGSVGQSGGWRTGGRWRYSGGKIRVEAALTAYGDGSGTTGILALILPVNADQTRVSDSNLLLQWNGAVTGRAGRYEAATGRAYDWAVHWKDNSSLRFFAINSAQYLDGVSLAKNDEVYVALEYDPA